MGWRAMTMEPEAVPRVSSFAIKVRTLAASDRPSAGPSSTLEFVVGDITLDDSAAIVNPTNARLEGGGMVDLAVRRAAGPGLGDACRAALRASRMGSLSPGEAVITPGFGLRAGYVIHCVPPRYVDDPVSAPTQLALCCQNAIAIARSQGLSSLAFPSIATGVLGYPLDEAAQITVATVIQEVARETAPFCVRFVLYGPSMLDAYVSAATVYLRRARA
jgi:O-acetyl-ADP-ribose deacetylase